MAFTRIKDSDLAGKGVKDQSTVPGLSAEEMKASVEQIVREVAIPGVNRLVDELGAESAAGNIGMPVPSTMPPETGATVGEIVTEHIENKENPHGVTAAQVGAYTRQETDDAIDQKVQAIGAADMSKAEFATNGRPGIVDKAVTAETADSATAADDGVKVYTHSRSGTVNELTGDGPNGRALMTADVQPGDTWKVNGQPVTAYMGTEDATDSMAGQPYNGKWVTFVVEGATLNFNGGGGLSATDKALLTPENIRGGVTLFNGTPREVVGSGNVVLVDSDTTRMGSVAPAARPSGTAEYTPVFAHSKYVIFGTIGNTGAGMSSAISFTIKIGDEVVLQRSISRNPKETVPFDLFSMDKYRTGQLVFSYSSTDTEYLSAIFIEIGEP